MPERFPTEIFIGGPVSNAVIPQLIAKITEQEVQTYWGGPEPLIHSQVDLLRYRNDKGHLWFCHEEQAWGAFKELEDFLVSAHIPFDRRTSAKYEYQGQLAQFRPGMDAPNVAASDDDGNLIVHVSDVSKVRDILRVDRSPIGIAKALERLNAICADATIGLLARFEIL